MDFLQHNALYVVGIISAVIWLGLFLFMFGIERRLRKLEKES
ncbi:MAG TPA: CcmD family protein [Candidatus Kapabacteria bacterium]|nr:CcmD family protein [Candidatus Kapabacteria bacterium]